MEYNLTAQLILYHLETSLLAWLIAIIVGGGLGYLFTLLIRYGIQHLPWLRSLLVVFPWRSIATWIALVLGLSGLLIIQFGLGFPADTFTIGGVLLVFIIPWVTQTTLSPYFYTNSLQRIISFGRTLAVLSIGIAVIFHFGLGNFMDNAYANLNEQKITQGYAVIGIMMMVIDLLFGIGQLLAAEKKPAHL